MEFLLLCCWMVWRECLAKKWACGSSLSVASPLRRSAHGIVCCNIDLQHRKEKPWDHDGIEHWKIEPFSKEHNPAGLAEESSFAILFPRYRGEVWVQGVLEDVSFQRF